MRLIVFWKSKELVLLENKREFFTGFWHVSDRMRQYEESHIDAVGVAGAN